MMAAITIALGLAYVGLHIYGTRRRLRDYHVMKKALGPKAVFKVIHGEKK